MLFPMLDLDDRFSSFVSSASCYESLTEAPLFILIFISNCKVMIFWGGFKLSTIVDNFVYNLPYTYLKETRQLACV